MDTTKIVDSETKEDMEFLLSFVPATDVNQVEPGLMSMFYITGTYDGDVKLVSRVQSIVNRYGLDTCCLDESDE